MINKILFSLAILTTTLITNAIENATIRVAKIDNTQEEYRVKLENLGNDIWRFKMPKEKITNNIKHIAIINDWAVAHCHPMIVSFCSFKESWIHK